MSLLDKARKKAQAENWQPEAGDGIEGTLVTVDARVGYEGASYLAYTLETVNEETGEVAYAIVHAFHTTLAKDLAEAHLVPGDQVAILYNGTQKPKSGKGKAYHHYTVAYEKQERPGEHVDAPGLPGDGEPNPFNSF